MLRHLRDQNSSIKAGRKKRPDGTSTILRGTMQKARSPANLVHVSARRIVFEDGTTFDVSAFHVSRFCVTIGEFLHFQRETGYLSTAEREGSTVSISDHYAIEDLTPEERDRAIANQVSWDDAASYCAWAGGRLILEAEWLAASIHDWNDLRPNIRGIKMEESIYAENPDQMCIEGPEWTGTCNGAGEALIRNYPRYFLIEGWEKLRDRRNRGWLPKQYFNDVICFRVCFD